MSPAGARGPSRPGGRGGAVAEWFDAGGRPVITSTRRAKERLGWPPRYTGLEALRDTLRAD